MVVCWCSGHDHNFHRCRVKTGDPYVPSAPITVSVSFLLLWETVCHESADKNTIDGNMHVGAT